MDGLLMDIKMNTGKEENTKLWYENWFNSKYYHILYQDRNHQEAEAFIDTLFAYLNLPKKAQVVDMACGKGRHAKKIADLGYETIGLDLSEESIHDAMRFEKSNLHFFIHDMLKSPVNHFQNADIVLNLFTSFGYFKTLDKHLSVVKNFSDCIKSEGLFLFDFMNATKVVNELVAEEIKTLDGIDFKITKEFKNHIIYKTISFEDKGLNHEHTEEVFALDFNDFQTIFNACGFTIEKSFGDYQLNEFDKDNSSRLIILAKKN